MRTVIIAFLLTVAWVPAQESKLIPLGDPHYYPSSDRPFGWRGDGTGYFPGANPVSTWHEGRAQFVDHKGTKRKWLDRQRKNIVWKTRMPCFANSQPIIVGDLVFTTAEPFALVCVDAHSGDILWVRENSPFELMGLPAAEAEALQTYVDQVFALIATFRPLVGNYTRLPMPITAQRRQMWLRCMYWAKDILLTMATGPYGERADEGLQRVEALLTELEQLSAGESKDDLAAAMVKVAGTTATWIHESFGFYPAGHWDGYTGWTFPSPVSDGSFIYASMGQGQVVCYDLTGKAVWRRFFKTASNRRVGTPGCNMSIEHCGSPLLIGDVLIARITARPESGPGLYALDRRSGETLWTTDNIADTVRSPGHLRIPLPGGGILDALAGTDHIIRRVSDGTVLAKVNVEHGNGPNQEGSTHIVDRNFWYICGKNKMVGLAITASSPDNITVKRIWDVSCGQRSHTSVLVDGYLHRFDKRGTVIKVADGSSVTTAQPNSDGIFTMKQHYPSPIAAGSFLINYEMTGYRRSNPYIVRSQVLELTSPNQVRMLSDTNWLDADPLPNMPRLAQHLPDYEAYKQARLFTRCGGIPSQFGYGSMAAAGNRLFLRSIGDLICIGDPEQALHWNPESRPHALTDQVNQMRHYHKQATAIERLASPSAWERQQALQEITAWSAAERTAKLPALHKQLHTTKRQAHLSIATLVPSMGSEAKPMAQTFVALTKQYIGTSDTPLAKACIRALRTLDAAATTEVLPAVKALFAAQDARKRRLAAILCAELAQQADPLVPQLEQLLTTGNRVGKRAAVSAMLHVGLTVPETVTTLKEQLHSQDQLVGIMALQALAVRQHAAQTAWTSVAETLTSSDTALCLAALDTLAKWGSAAQAAKKAITACLSKQDPRIVQASTALLLQWEPDSQEAVAKRLLQHLNRNTGKNRQAVMRAIATHMGQVTLSEDLLDDLLTNLVAVLRSDTPRLKREAALTIASFGPSARQCIGALKKAALGSECSTEAKHALLNIDPSIDVTKLRQSIRPGALDDDDDSIDDDLDLDLD